MPRKSSRKSGGAFAYVDQFDYPLSPCYKPNNKAPIPKLGWHAGGASSDATCDKMVTVAEMGIKDTPLTKVPSPSELAWDNRYRLPKGDLPIQNGGKKKMLDKLNKEFSNKKSSVISIEANRGGKQKLINVVNVDNKFVVSITDKDSNKSQYLETSSQEKVNSKLKQFNITKFNRSKKL